MKKQILFFAVAALALASCSSENDVVQSPDVQQTADDGAVVFDVYTQRTTTRAGWAGEVKTNLLRENTDDAAKLGASGFGVFGYYTNNNTYDQQAIPNFLYNQQVKWDGGAFTYAPVKYWPNEYGTSAISDDADKVSFFAYAPYVEVVPSTGKVLDPQNPKDQAKAAELQKWGINSMTRNSATGDPLVKYLVSFDPTHSVDLCWGVCDNTSWPKVLTGSNQDINDGKLGLPWLNVERPADATGSQKLKFTFKHALAKLNVQIDTYVDGVSAGNVATGTKVFVRSITFEGLADKGALNLNNNEAGQNKAYWMDYAGTNDLVTGEDVTIYDGRKDGKEGTLGGEATNEKVLGLNPQLIQSTLWAATENTTGVLGAAQNLFRKWNPTGGAESKGAYEAAGLLDPIYVIPTGDAVKVTIVYDVETADENLFTYLSDSEQTGSSIENRISKYITFGKDASGQTVNKLENGKAYTLKLHLGMNSVKFDAAVTTWEDNAANDVDLPANVPVYEAKDAPDLTEIALPHTAGTFQFAISGLEPYETITLPADVDNLTFAATSANASGISLVTITIKENKTVNNIVSADQIFNGTKDVKIKFTQEAHPLGLIATYRSSDGLIIFDSEEVTGTNWSAESWDDGTNIIVYKNGIKLAKGTDYDFTPAGSGTRIGFIKDKKSDPVAGDVYSITLKVGDAAQETVTVVVGNIAYAETVVNKVLTDGGFTHPLTLKGDGKLTFESNHTDVATVDENGRVTFVKTGSCTIKAKVTPADYNFFLSTEASYTLNIGNVISGGELEKSYSSSSASSEKITICGLNASGACTIASSETWLTTTETPAVSTANGTLEVTYSLTETTVARDATITVKDLNTGKETKIKVYQAAP